MVAIAFRLAGKTVRLAPGSFSIGRSGALPGDLKREGDGATPIGEWAVLYGFFRPDRLPEPDSALMMHAIVPSTGWCDDPHHMAYNLPVCLPFSANHERMHREDGLYDIVIVLSHNLVPPVAGLGSAIFLHCRAEDGGPTEGCIALARAELIKLVRRMRPGDVLAVTA